MPTHTQVDVEQSKIQSSRQQLLGLLEGQQELVARFSEDMAEGLDRHTRDTQDMVHEHARQEEVGGTALGE